MKLFDINEFAARFPNALCGIFTLLLLFNFGKKLINENFGIWWAVAYGGSILPFLYFKSGIIDPWFNLFIFAGIYFIYGYLCWNENKRLNLFLSALVIGLAILTKGPVAFLIFCITFLVFGFFKKFRFYFRWVDIFIYLFVVGLVGGFWFILQIFNGNFTIIQDFVIYQIRLFKTEDAGHGGFLFYHFVVILLGVFPVSIFALKAFVKKGLITLNSDFLLLMKVLLWVVLIIFTIVKTKIIHYSSLAYFPLTFLGGYIIYLIVERKMKINNWMLGTVGIISSLYGLLIISLPIIDKFKSNIIESGLIKDEFALGNLQAQAQWTGWEALIGLFLILGVAVALWFLKREKVKVGFIVLFTTTILFTYSTLIFIVPRIEEYSQHAAIEFFKDVSNKDCYVTTINYKSYAPYFYGNKQIPVNIQQNNAQWLLKGNIDKPVYFIMKNTSEEGFFNEYPYIHKLYEKNGFVMAIRNIQTN
jgi:4-amino-4-deoxy-L-arabinose transferase-like glycosyltransferase